METRSHAARDGVASDDGSGPSGSPATVIRVVVVDDHPVVNAGISQFMDLEDDISVVGKAFDGATAASLDAELTPDVILMDLVMPVLDGLVATRRVLAARPEACIVMLTSSAEHDGILAAIDAGVCGYLLKDTDPRILVESVRAAARGEWPVDPAVTRALMRARREAHTVVRLSDRELEVVRLVATGMLNKQIARALGIGEKTVKAHLSRVFQRLGVTKRSQAVAWAVDNGLLEAPAGT